MNERVVQRKRIIFFLFAIVFTNTKKKKFHFIPEIAFIVHYEHLFLFTIFTIYIFQTSNYPHFAGSSLHFIVYIRNLLFSYYFIIIFTICIFATTFEPFFSHRDASYGSPCNPFLLKLNVNFFVARALNMFLTFWFSFELS